jgi:L-ascorbate metabolism protein UlaG (beta-lactamase superfamily)
MTLAATYLGANGWLLDFNGLRVLVDPWLKGELSFPPGAWLLRGKLGEERDAPDNLDLLLLTQGLADHSHRATLKTLPKELPVVGSASAARVVKRLGFQSISALKPGESLTHKGLSIRATAGAPVPSIENGYLLKHSSGSLYLEPHGFLDPSLGKQQLDAVITPMVDLGLPLAGAFVKGCTVVPELVERFQPTTVLASTSGGDVRFDGALSRMLQLHGSIGDAAKQLPADTRCIDSEAGERYVLSAR